MSFVFLRSRFVPCLVLALAGCHASTEPSNPPREIAIEREWQFLVTPRDGYVDSLGGPRTLDVGTVTDREEFGRHPLVPAGAEQLGFAELFSSSTGETYWARAQSPFAASTNGDLIGSGVTYAQYTGYVIDTDHPTMTLTVTGGLQEAIDFDPRLPDADACEQDPGEDFENCGAPIAAGFMFGVDVFPRFGTPIVSMASTVALLGSIGNWFGYVRAMDADVADSGAFHDADFQLDPDVDHNNLRTHATYRLTHPVPFHIPIDSLAVGDTFYVDVGLLVLAEDERQGESFGGAYFRDPVTPLGVTIEASGLHRIAAVRGDGQLPAVVPDCAAGSTGAAGTVQFSSSTYSSPEGGFFNGRVQVTRTGGTDGAVNVLLTTSPGSATAGSDYQSLTTLVHFGDGAGGSHLVRVPIIRDHVDESDETINLTLSNLHGCAALGGQTSAVLTIRDDDAPTPATFAIGGRVTGLVGSGLVLREQTSGFEVAPVADGQFTIMPAANDGSGYQVVVKTNPATPLQVCTVANGTGVVAGGAADSIVVSCTTPSSPTGLDPTFGSGGRATATLSGGATALAIQGDGKSVVVGGGTLLRFTSDGTLDQGFGTAGQASLVVAGATVHSLQDVVLQPDGKIVVIGFVTIGTHEACVVARYSSGGAPDAGFGNGGQALLDFGGVSARGWAVALQPDGKIIAAGQATLGSGPTLHDDFAVARLTSDGAPDASFGVLGARTTDAGGTSEWANAVAVAVNGSIALAGRTAPDGGTDPDIAVVRYTADGTPDSTFGGDGVVTSTLDQPDLQEAYDLVIQPDGRIVVAGASQVAGAFNYVLARFLATGSLDGSFNGTGYVFTPFTTQGDLARSMVVQSDGKFVLAGRIGLLGTSDMGLARFSSAGTLDPSFGTGGKLAVDFFGNIDGAEAVAIQPDGKIVAAGFARSGTVTGVGLVRVVP